MERVGRSRIRPVQMDNIRLIIERNGIVKVVKRIRRMDDRIEEAVLRWFRYIETKDET